MSMLMISKTPFRSSKYKAHKTIFDGITFDSKLEAFIYLMLKEKQNHGEIANLKRQVSVKLTDAKILLKIDFSYKCPKTGDTVYYEVKGHKTPVWRLKQRLWKHYGPSQLYVVGGSIDSQNRLKLKIIIIS